MRKVMVLLLMMISTLTLSACDLLGGDIDEVIDNARNIAETFTMEDQTIEIGTENYDWAAYVMEINDNLPDDINIEVVEDNIEYGVPGTYTVTLRLTAPNIDFSHTFNVTVVEGGLSPEEIIGGFDGDITYLQTFMDPIMNSDAKETTTTIMFDVNEMDYMTGEMVRNVYSIESISTIVHGESMDLMSQEMVISNQDEVIPFSFYLVREDTSLTFYLETSTLETMMGEWDEALAEELGITDDFIMFSVEGDFSNEEELDFMTLIEGFMLYAEDLMLDVDPEEVAYVQAQLEYAVANMELFAKYLTLEYYMNQEGMTAELDVDDNDAVVMSMTMDPTMYGSVINDLLTDFSLFASGLEGVEVPDMQSAPEYQQLLMILNGLQPMQMDAVYNPNNPTVLSFRIDLTTFVNTLAMMTSNGEMMAPPVNALTIDVVVRSGAEVAIPEVASDMNIVVKNIAKLMFVQEVYYSANELISYVEMSNENPLYTANEVPMNVLASFAMYDDTSYQMFDQDLSYIVNRGSLEVPEYYIHLVWLDGTDVFVDELSLNEIEVLIYESDTITPIIELVNDAAFDLSKLSSLME